MSRYGAPRDNVSRPFEGYPAYGAVHDVLPSHDIREFIDKFSGIADKVFIEGERDTSLIIRNEMVSEDETDTESTTNGIDYDSRVYYKVFDPETLGVSVVEMDPAAQHARAIRTIWEGQDFGSVEQEARNQINRLLVDRPMRLVCNSVRGVGHRLPNTPKTMVRQKLALLPDPTAYLETAETISGEADIIIQAIKQRLKQFVYPWDLIPHMTFSVFKTASQPEQITEIVRATNEHLNAKPLEIKLGELIFRSKAVRKQRH